jgi:hypothetical protein
LPARIKPGLYQAYHRVTGSSILRPGRPVSDDRILHIGSEQMTQRRFEDFVASHQYTLDGGCSFDIRHDANLLVGVLS